MPHARGAWGGGNSYIKGQGCSLYLLGVEKVVLVTLSSLEKSTAELLQYLLAY